MKLPIAEFHYFGLIEVKLIALIGLNYMAKGSFNFKKFIKGGYKNRQKDVKIK